MLKSMIFLGLMLVASFAKAQGYDYKHLSDFKPLSAYPNAAAFEKNYRDYVQHCLDNTNGGLEGIPCLIGSKLWDRELNRYYQKLAKVLNHDEKALLLTSERAWLKERDASEKFSNAILRKIYPQQGTMYQLMSASDADDTLSDIIKSRTLLLKKWYDAMKGND